MFWAFWQRIARFLWNVVNSWVDAKRQVDKAHEQDFVVARRRGGRVELGEVVEVALDPNFPGK